MLAPQAVDTPVIRRFTDAVVQHRRVYFITIAVLFILAFNGEWKIGRDSAMYRGVARNLAEGNGYTFSEFASSTIYPGLPYLLAGFYRLVGESAVLPLLAMNGMALVTVIFSYKLVRLHYEQWIAIAVAAGVGLNAVFLRQANDLMTDLPFMMTVVITLYGWERLKAAVSWQQRTLAAAYMLPAFAAAALLRPMVWVLVLALLMVSAWEFIRGPRRRFFAAVIGVVIVVVLAVALLDPRTRGFRPWNGGYIQLALAQVNSLGPIVLDNLRNLLTRELSAAFFGQRFTDVPTALISLVVIGSSLLLWRRHPLWTLLILLTIGATLAMSTQSRYYLMILPLLVLSWVLLFRQIALRVPQEHGGTVLLAGLLLLAIPNFIRCCTEVSAQRWRNVGNMRDWSETVELAEAMRQVVPEDATVLADDSATVLAYFSRRHVVMNLDVLPRRKSERQFPTHLAALGIDYALFPSTLYDRDRHRIIGQMMDREIIIPGERIVRVNGQVICRVEFRVPEGHWRKEPVTTLASEEVLARTTPAERARAEARQRRERRLERQERQEAAARREAKLAKERKAAKARKRRAAERARTTQEATPPAPPTSPATRPSLSAPATGPTTQPLPLTNAHSPPPLTGG